MSLLQELPLTRRNRNSSENFLRDFPPELLLEIFSFCLPDKVQNLSSTRRRTIKVHNLPPNRTEAPWSLGEVCSLWRFLSRSCPGLWGKTMINIDESARRGYPHRCHPTDSLPAAAFLLPQEALLSVTYRGKFPRTPVTLVPHIWRIQELFLTLNTETYEALWELVSPDAFLLLQSLGLSFCKNHAAQLNQGDLTHWERFKPFELAQCLRKFTMESSPHLGVLSLNIPWKQLESLHIYAGADTDFQISHSALLNCPSLTELSLRTLGVYDARDTPTPTLNTPTKSLRLLELNHVWNNLLSLDLFNAELSAEVLHGVLVQCTQLVTLASPLPLRGHHISVTRMINLPYLKNLSFSHPHDSWLFKMLAVPSLTSLEVQTGIFQHLSVIRDLETFVSSGKVLSTFKYQVQVPDWDYNRAFLDAAAIRDLLATIASATEVEIGKESCIPLQCLRDIAAGVLLPKLRYLRCQPESLDAFFDMVEARLANDTRAGRATLREVVYVGIEPEPTSEEKDRLAERLKALYGQYPQSIKCTLLD